MKFLVQTFLSVLLLCPAASAAEAVLVIANKARVSNLHITKADLSDLFQGKKRTIGEWRVDLIDQAPTSQVREDFYRLLLGKSVSEMSTQWAELTFSGRARAPKVLQDDVSVVSAVKANPNAIGYVGTKTTLPSEVVAIQELKP